MLEGALKVFLARPHCLCSRGTEWLPRGSLTSWAAKHGGIAGKEGARHSLDMWRHHQGMCPHPPRGTSQGAGTSRAQPHAEPFQQPAPKMGPRQVPEQLVEHVEAQESAGRVEHALAPTLILSCQYTDWN